VDGATDLLGRLSEGEDHLRIGDRRVADVDEVQARRLHPQGALGDHEVAEVHPSLQGAARAAADHHWSVDTGAELDDRDLGAAGAHARSHDGHRQALVDPGEGDELTVSTLDRHLVEEARDSLSPPGVAYEDDRRGDLSRGEIDVVLTAAFVADLFGRVHHGRCLVLAGGTVCTAPELLREALGELFFGRGLEGFALHEHVVEAGLAAPGARGLVLLGHAAEGA